jgi:hypothetical protein
MTDHKGGAHEEKISKKKKEKTKKLLQIQLRGIHRRKLSRNGELFGRCIRYDKRGVKKKDEEKERKNSPRSERISA